ncbi:unnamed protein product [Closterium sp. Yama58-4]|nr:unnamed protein product [Closterium sp. Yama58-4]
MRSSRIATHSSFSLSLSSWIEILIPSKESDEQMSRLRACTSELKAEDQVTAERNTCDALGLLHPDGPRFHAWNVLIHTLVMWSSFWVTLEFAFIPNPSAGILYFDSAVCLIFVANIAVTFKAAFRSSKTLRLVTSRKAIATRYAKGGLLFDVLSSIPLTMFYFLATGQPASGALGYAWNEQPLGVFHHSLFQACAVFPSILHLPFPHERAQNILLASHLFAVAYFFLTLMEPDPANTWIGQGIGPDWPEQPVFLQYVAALWWSIFVITSIGPAYTSVTTAEQIFSCFYALFGMATVGSYASAMGINIRSPRSQPGVERPSVFGYPSVSVTCASSRVHTGHVDSAHEDMAALKAYVARTNLPADVERQLKQQLRVQLQMHKSDASSFLSSIPHHLRVTVSRQLYLPIVENLDGFRLCSTTFLNQLVSEMNVKTVMRNDIVTSEGDVSTHLYIVLSGKLVREDGPAAALQSEFSSFLTAGSVFGKTAVMCDVPQLFTVRALEHSQLLRLSKSAFSAIARAYPADSSILYSALKQKIDGSDVLTRTPSEIAVSQGLTRSPPSWKALGATSEEPAQGEGAAGPVIRESVAVHKGDAAQVERVCAAAASGRVDQLNELLSAAPSLAHCHDYNDRTPLHVAAAHGHVSCINAILQRNGVDVNALDRSGSTPLLEAVKNGQSKAAEALQAAGAALLLKDPGSTLCCLAASAAAEASSSQSGSSSSKSGGGSNVQYLERLLTAGADVNAQDHAGCTALHVACANRSIAVAKLLMAHGANPHLEDMSGNTAYDLASTTDSPDLLTVLDK